MNTSWQVVRGCVIRLPIMQIGKSSEGALDCAQVVEFNLFEILKNKMQRKVVNKEVTL